MELYFHADGLWSVNCQQQWISIKYFLAGWAQRLWYTYHPRALVSYLNCCWVRRCRVLPFILFWVRVCCWWASPFEAGNGSEFENSALMLQVTVSHSMHGKGKRLDFVSQAPQKWFWRKCNQVHVDTGGQKVKLPLIDYEVAQTTKTIWRYPEGPFVCQHSPWLVFASTCMYLDNFFVALNVYRLLHFHFWCEHLPNRLDTSRNSLDLNTGRGHRIHHSEMRDVVTRVL